MIIIRKILYIINILAALALSLTYIAAYIPQNTFTKLSLLGYLYTYLLLINVIFIVIWIFLKPSHLFLSLFVILIRVNYIPRLVNFQSEKEKGELSVLTYNLKYFSHKMEEKFDKQASLRLQDSILTYIRSTNAGIVCFQDFTDNIKSKKSFHNKMVDSLGYNNFYFAHMQNNIINNCIIYSKYPIVGNGLVDSLQGMNYSFIYADIKTPKKTVRVINMHLASYILGQQEKNDFKKITEGNISKKASKNIIRKLLNANRYRAEQIKTLFPMANTPTQKPVIMLGDFNDHPFSYTYKQATKKFSDSFVSKGHGIGKTYNGIFPSFRIDYILYDKSRLDAISYSSPHLDYSDHYPVFVTFNFIME